MENVQSPSEPDPSSMPSRRMSASGSDHWRSWIGHRRSRIGHAVAVFLVALGILSWAQPVAAEGDSLESATVLCSGFTDRSTSETPCTCSGEAAPEVAVAEPPVPVQVMLAADNSSSDTSASAGPAIEAVAGVAVRPTPSSQAAPSLPVTGLERDLGLMAAVLVMCGVGALTVAGIPQKRRSR